MSHSCQRSPLILASIPLCLFLLSQRKKSTLRLQGICYKESQLWLWNQTSVPLSYFEGVWEILCVFGFLNGVEAERVEPHWGWSSRPGWGCHWVFVMQGAKVRSQTLNLENDPFSWHQCRNSFKNFRKCLCPQCESPGSSWSLCSLAAFKGMVSNITILKGESFTSAQNANSACFD